MFTKSLIFASLPIASLSVGPSLYSITQSDYSLPIQEEQEEDNEGCTVMYVGKDVSADGRAMIARSSDSGPHSLMLNGQVFEHNELAGQTVHGNNGFSWKMPDTTYRYVSTPRNPAMGKGLHWEASGINENGVGVSATLSCFTTSDATDLDPFERETGISEDNIAQIVGAVATSARQGIEYVTKIIDQVGSRDANAIMTIDQNEAWYMEMYTGHQYAAIKLPDDKACTVGNEFAFDSLAEMNPEDVILSEGLFDLVKDFAVYDAGHKGEYNHMQLANTYGATLSHQNHTRTWRGGNMFAYHTFRDGEYIYQDYKVPTVKYPFFFEPEGDGLSVNDVKSYMRDRYEDLIAPGDKHLQWFQDQEENHALHYVGNEGAYQIHIIKAVPDAPKEFGVEEWLCLSSSNYAPFVPLSSATTAISDYYSHKCDTYAYDDQAASFIFRQLYRLADTHREFYGLPTQHMYETYEDIWKHQFDQVSNEVFNIDVDSARDIITNFSIHIQNEAIKLAKYEYEILLMHAIDDFTYEDETHYTLFTPLISLKDFTSLYGWSYEREGTAITLKNKNDVVVVDTTPTTSYAFGSITKNGEKRNIRMSQKGEDVRIDFDMMLDYFVNGYDLVDINIDDYRSKPEPEPEPENDPMKWMVPLASTMPVVGVGAGVGGTTFVFKFKKGKLLKIFKK